MPTVSVIIPTCDRPGRLTAALDSVRAQTLTPHEVIVVDDGTRPSAARPPEHVRVLRGRGGAGPSASRNLGAHHAVGEYLAFLDDDDVWDEAYLAEIFPVLQSSPDVVIARLDQRWKERALRRGTMPDLTTFEASLLAANPGITGSNIVVRRRFFLDIGGFNERFRNSNDRDFGLRVVDHQGTIALAPRAVAIQQIHPDGHHLSLGLRSVRGKMPFLVHYWARMTPRQRSENVGRLTRIVRKAFRERRRSVLRRLSAPLASRMRAHRGPRV